MTNISQENPLQTLQEIRRMMENSSKFLSLSGLSGVAVGTMALLGAGAAFWALGVTPFDRSTPFFDALYQESVNGYSGLQFIFLDALVVLLAALAGGLFFTYRKASLRKQKLWGPMTFRFAFNLLLPLVTGGIFCIALYQHQYVRLIPATTLIFYGLALVQASKYTFHTIRNLGILEIILGLVALFFARFGLEFWAIGFGIMHIVYGIYMYVKYE